MYDLFKTMIGIKITVDVEVWIEFWGWYHSDHLQNKNKNIYLCEKMTYKYKFFIFNVYDEA